MKKENKGTSMTKEKHSPVKCLNVNLNLQKHKSKEKNLLKKVDFLYVCTISFHLCSIYGDFPTWCLFFLLTNNYRTWKVGSADNNSPKKCRIDK